MKKKNGKMRDYAVFSIK